MTGSGPSACHTNSFTDLTLETMDNSIGFDEPLDFGDLIERDSVGANSFTAINQPAGPATISPRDLYLDSPALANSMSQTNLTTPSLYNGSPDDSFYDTSPAYAMNDDDTTWPSLFPNGSEQLYASAKQSNNTYDSMHDTTMERTISSSSNEATSEPLRHRMSSTSGVFKNRRTGRVLEPIKVSETDEIAFKRAKNTMAARKSRQKKRDVEECLRIELQAMTAERDRWMHQAIAHGAPVPTSPLLRPQSFQE